MFCKTECKNQADWGLLMLRVALGVVFIAHGWAKIQNLEGTIMFFAGLGFAALFAYLVAWVEFLGGISMLLGYGTRISGLLLAVTMVVAIWSVKLPNGLLGGAGKPGYELDLVLLLSALAVVCLGSGKFSLFKKFDCCAKKAEIV